MRAKIRMRAKAKVRAEVRARPRPRVWNRGAHSGCSPPTAPPQLQLQQPCTWHARDMHVICTSLQPVPAQPQLEQRVVHLERVAEVPPAPRPDAVPAEIERGERQA